MKTIRSGFNFQQRCNLEIFDRTAGVIVVLLRQI